MAYVLVNPAHAENLNRSIMRLIRPEHLRSGYVTDLYCTMHTHPETGYMALDLPDTQTVPIHIESSGDELVAMLQVFVDDEALTQEEMGGIVTALTGLGGQQVRILDFIPASWQDFVLTKEQMDADGWFPEPEVI
tara:strand:- start:58 stop:462 length:405 start_codon:yes stop_codon:yes gene_type:complete